MARNLGINIRIGADLKKFSKDMQNVQRQMKRTGRELKRTGANLSRSVTLPFLAAAGASAKFAADFEQSMAKVQAISGATGSNFKKLEENALELGRTTRYTAQQVAELQLNLSKLGFNPTEITDATGAILNLALATGEDLAESATVAAATLRGFGMDAKESGRVADVMAKSFSSSGLDLEKFKVAMSKIAPVAKASGLSLEQTSAMMSVLADAGVEASTIGTSLRQIFIQLASSGMSYSDAMKQINGSTNQLKTATDLFGDRASSVALILAKNTDRANELNRSYVDASGSAKDMAAIMDNTTQGAMLRMRSALEGLAISFGNQLAPIIIKLAGIVERLASKFTALSPEVKKLIVILGAVYAAVGPITFIFGQLMISATALTPLFVKFGISVTGLAGAFVRLHGAIGLAVIIVEAINTLVKKASPIYKKTATQIKSLETAYDNLQKALNDVKEAQKDSTLSESDLNKIKLEKIQISIVQE